MLCNKCGSPDHLYRNCPYVTSTYVKPTCTYCGRPGHNSRDCYRRKNDNEHQSNRRPHYQPQQHRTQPTQIHTVQQQQPETNQQNLDTLFDNHGDSYFGNNRPHKSPRLFKLTAAYAAFSNVYQNSYTFKTLNDACNRNGVTCMMIDSGAAASVFSSNRPSICKEACEATGPYWF